ncbi:hypothetical protein [Amaricoccus sp.]|uniref:DUF7662 domain-containing protein n=1 Tax=Amaricoccus sp. TaxID=1872485 RepID=UPI001B52FC46|nr:hypothetical protein [Amaricoccus sp.]MBP7000331.1 hypothetical protein [Amaricoccus sp.]
MSKYEPLRDHLQRHRREQVPMAFDEIEAILGFSLPASSRRHRTWWSNNASNSAITRAWLDAGFQTEQVDMAAGRLVFHRFAAVEQVGTPRPGRHPLLGCMKGTVTFAPDFRPGEPADPDWGGADTPG